MDRVLVQKRRLLFCERRGWRCPRYIDISYKPSCKQNAYNRQNGRLSYFFQEDKCHIIEYYQANRGAPQRHRPQKNKGGDGLETVNQAF